MWFRNKKTKIKRKIIEKHISYNFSFLFSFVSELFCFASFRFLSFNLIFIGSNNIQNKIGYDILHFEWPWRRTKLNQQLFIIITDYSSLFYYSYLGMVNRINVINNLYFKQVYACFTLYFYSLCVKYTERRSLIVK